VVRSPTFRTIFFFRALDPDPVKANALKTGVQVYPFSWRDGPAPTRYLTISRHPRNACHLDDSGARAGILEGALRSTRQQTHLRSLKAMLVTE
jgi:hypothetical protein